MAEQRDVSFADCAAQTERGHPDMSNKVKTFTLDLTAGMSPEQIKTRYRQLVRAVGEMQRIAMMLATPENIEALPEPYRTKMRNLFEAYRD